MAAVTRLGLHGGPRAPYGSFAGKSEYTLTTAAGSAVRFVVRETTHEFVVRETTRTLTVSETGVEFVVREV